MRLQQQHSSWHFGASKYPLVYHENDLKSEKLKSEKASKHNHKETGLRPLPTFPLFPHLARSQSCEPFQSPCITVQRNHLTKAHKRHRLPGEFPPSIQGKSPGFLDVWNISTQESWVQNLTSSLPTTSCKQNRLATRAATHIQRSRSLTEIWKLNVRDKKKHGAI